MCVGAISSSTHVKEISLLNRITANFDLRNIKYSEYYVPVSPAKCIVVNLRGHLPGNNPANVTNVHVLSDFVGELIRFRWSAFLRRIPESLTTHQFSKKRLF